jgi:hypothetical protein
MAIQDEIDQLRREWIAAGGNAQEFEAWRQGASTDEHLADIREKLRKLLEGERE